MPPTYKWRQRRPPRDARLAEPCQECGARPAEYCIRANGNPRTPHPERLEPTSNGTGGIANGDGDDEMESAF